MKVTIYLLIVLYIIVFPYLYAQTITITTPNGGETWQNSNSFGIVWTDDIPDFVKIQLYKGGILNSTIAASVSSNGYYLWTPNVIETGVDYKIKITSVLDSSIFDFSDGNFTISKSVINITAPNGGENLQTSYPYGITYDDNFNAFVKIELYKGGSFYSTIVNSAPSNGYYLWLVDAMESGNDYKVKITSLASSNDYDFSDADFTVTKSEISILVPNGGEVFLAGADNSIVYTDNIQGPFKIELYKGGTFHSTIIDTIPSNGFYLWAVPDTIPDGTDYKIKITSLNSVNDFDFSDNNFSIDNPNNIDDIINQMPNEFTLMQNYPNPFNPTTSILFGLPLSSEVRIDLFNAVGEKVDIIFSGYKEAGYHKINYDASFLSTGIYFYRLQAISVEGQTYIETKKFVLLK